MLFIKNVVLLHNLSCENGSFIWKEPTKQMDLFTLFGNQSSIDWVIILYGKGTSLWENPVQQSPNA